MTTSARRRAAFIAFAAFGFATSAFAEDKNVKIGVLNDMSSLYADIGGPNSARRPRWRSMIPACPPRAGRSRF